MGLSTAVGGGDVGDISTLIAASKNAVENNFVFLAPAIPAAVAAAATVTEAVIACYATGPCVAITAGVVTALGYELLEESKQNSYPSNILDPNDLPKLEGYPIPEEPRDPLPGYKPLEPDELGPNHTGHDGGLDDFDIRHDTGGNQIPDKDWRDNILTSQQPYEPNKGAVGNMGEFLGQPCFGTDVKNNSTKTNRQYDGQSIYTANDDIKGTGIKRGDQFYLDGLHKDHIEVFDSRGKFKFVLNLDGSLNKNKTTQAEGRRLPK